MRRWANIGRAHCGGVGESFGSVFPAGVASEGAAVVMGHGDASEGGEVGRVSTGDVPGMAMNGGGDRV